MGAISASHTSVSGPAAGLTAIVAAQITTLGSFEAFLTAVALAGVLQIAFGVARGGFLAAFFPSSVIKGLLAAIGVILILKQIPHLFGHDPDPMGEMQFDQPDQQNTFSELWNTVSDLHPSAAVIGVVSLALLIAWQRMQFLRESLVPPALVVVVLGVALGYGLEGLGEAWVLEGPPDGSDHAGHLVRVPIATDASEFLGLLTHPDASALMQPAVYLAAVTIALVASLETLLNLEAVDNLDPLKRDSKPSRELVAQGVGNLTAGLVGALPVTSVIVRSSVNINSGARSKLSTLFHGVLLIGSIALIPQMLNRIPLSALAAILIVTGFKLASPKLFREMAAKRRDQFLPFLATVVAIVLTDLLSGILIGLAIAIAFILHSNLRNPMRNVREKHAGGDVDRIELNNQVTFLNRAALSQALQSAPHGGHLMLDASQTDYIDPDVLDLILDFRDNVAPHRGIQLSLVGFKKAYEELGDRIEFVDYASREVQSKITPAEVFQLLKDGNERFRTGQRIRRDYVRQMSATAPAQFPIAAVLSCIDSRAPVELLFDQGLGDLFCVRIAGNVAKNKVIGSLEYSCVVAGAKLILVMGHTACGAVTAAVDLFHEAARPSEATGCDNLDVLVEELQKAMDTTSVKRPENWSPGEKREYVDWVARRNVRRTILQIRKESRALDRMVREGKILIAGAMYDVHTGSVEFFEPEVADAPIPTEAS